MGPSAAVCLCPGRSLLCSRRSDRFTLTRLVAACVYGCPPWARRCGTCDPPPPKHILSLPSPDCWPLACTGGPPGRGAAVPAARRHSGGAHSSGAAGPAGSGRPPRPPLNRRRHHVVPGNNDITSFHGSSCANNGKGALDTPGVKHVLQESTGRLYRPTCLETSAAR
eukprot:6922529-Pyramimonas_sp.AAC.1